MTLAAKVALLALGAAVILPFVDAMVKLLVRDYSVVMIAWARMCVTALVLGFAGGAQIGLNMFKPVAWRLQILRGLAAVLGTTMVFQGFRTLPLADCTAIVFLAPVLANLFSHYGLKEPGDRFSWAIALISFVGVLAIAKPGTSLFTSAAIYPLLGAVGLALFMTLTRAVSAHDHPRVTAFFGPFVALLVFSLAMPWQGSMPKSGIDVAMFLSIGALASIAQVLQTRAYLYGTTHRVAPYGYASLEVALVLGWTVFGTVPDRWSVVGMTIIVAAGIAMVFRK